MVWNALNNKLWIFSPMPIRIVNCITDAFNATEESRAYFQKVELSTFS